MSKEQKFIIERLISRLFVLYAGDGMTPFIVEGLECSTETSWEIKLLVEKQEFLFSCFSSDYILVFAIVGEELEITNKTRLIEEILN